MGLPRISNGSTPETGSVGVDGPDLKYRDMTGTLQVVERTAHKGQANGYAELGADGKVPAAQLPEGGGGGTPGDTVASETAFGVSPAAGAATEYSRADHTHGTPTNPITAHEAAGDPHSGYQLESEKNAASGYCGLDGNIRVATARLATGTADSTVFLRGDQTWASLPDQIAAHVAAGDPHTQYQRESEKAAASGYASLDSNTRVPDAQLGTGTPSAAKFLGGDRSWSAVDWADLTGKPSTFAPSAHASSHQSGGGDTVKLDDLAATDDNTDLNASTSAHGLCPKFPGGTTNFLRADGSFAAPPGGGSGPTLAALGADHTLSSATPTEVTGLSQTSLATGTYVFQYFVRYQSSATGTGIRLSVNYTGTTGFFVATMRWTDVSATASTAAADQDAVIAAGHVQGSFGARAKSTAGWGTTISVDTANADMLIIISGTFSCSTSGDLELWHGSEGAVATSVMTGTSLILHKVA